MATTRRFRILEDGTVEGLWNDAMAGLGPANVTRASRVEFLCDINRWVVEILIGPLAGCFIAKTFTKRQEALDAEVSLLNDQLAAGLI